MAHLVRFGILLTWLLCLDTRGQLPETQKAGDTQPVKILDSATDEKIRNRIAGVFSEVPDFEKIQVKVQSGVVTLTGEVPGTRTRDEALALVRRTEGVVLTLDRMDEAVAVAARLTPALTRLSDLGQTFAKKLPVIGIALLTVILFSLLANFIHRRESWFGRLKISSLATSLVRRFVRIAIVGFGVVLALDFLDATAVVGTVLGAAGLAGLAIGFAFKNILENYLSGILLSTRNPFDIGDTIEIKGQTGKVARLTSRDTVLVTLDGNHLRIPNSIVINSELLNFTRNSRRRFEFLVGVSVDLDLSAARRIGLGALARNPAVLADPKPVVLVESLGDSNVSLKFLGWLDQKDHDFAKTRSESIRMVKEAFDQAGIEMPEPLYRIQVRHGAALPAGSSPADTAKSEKLQAVTQVTKPAEVSEQDLAVEDTIDRQIEEECRESQETNLLANPEKDG